MYIETFKGDYVSVLSVWCCSRSW